MTCELCRTENVEIEQYPGMTVMLCRYCRVGVHAGGMLGGVAAMFHEHDRVFKEMLEDVSWVGRVR